MKSLKSIKEIIVYLLSTAMITIVTFVILRMGLNIFSIMILSFYLLSSINILVGYKNRKNSAAFVIFSIIGVPLLIVFALYAACLATFSNGIH